MIELKNVSKSYSGKKALQNVNLRLPRGEIVGLIDKDGSVHFEDPVSGRNVGCGLTVPAGEWVQVRVVANRTSKKLIASLADESGRVTRVFCQYDRDSLSGTGGRKVKGVLHFVEKTSAVPAEVRLYDRLILDGEGDYTERFNENALVRMENAVAEASLAEQAPGTGFQFIRQGYFCLDPDSTGDRLVFNRTVGLRDTWAKINR